MLRSAESRIKGPRSPFILLTGGIPVVQDNPSLFTMRRNFGLFASFLQLYRLC